MTIFINCDDEIPLQLKQPIIPSSYGIRINLPGDICVVDNI